MMNDELKTIAAEPPFDPLTDTGKVAQAVKMVREQIRQDIMQSELRLEVRLESILVEREKTWTKRLHNIFAWIASQFKT